MPAILGPPASGHASFGRPAAARRTDQGQPLLVTWLVMAGQTVPAPG